MSSRTEAPQSVDALMFDFYGTVVDMQGGLIRAITPFLEDKGDTRDDPTASSHGGGEPILRTR